MRTQKEEQPMMYTDETFRYEAVPDAELQQLARAKGLFVARDKFEFWYLQLLDRPADGTIDPHFVMISKLREEIIRYVLEHEGDHRTLSPREVFGFYRDDPDDQDEE
jgi:hypothetical protein